LTAQTALDQAAAEAFKALQAKARAEHGVVIDPVSIGTEVTREGDGYQGVRCKLVAGLGNAKIPFALDFSFGDPTGRPS
jgi:hypothetical protein